MKEIVAKLKYHRTSPRKVRLVANLIRGKKIETAMNQLMFSSKKTAPVLIKLLKSAVSNAKNNFKIKEPENLYIKKITVDEGPALKRHVPRARGAASLIKKRTSHITIILDKK